MLEEINRNYLKKMKENLKYLKSETYKIPKDQEAKYKAKYDDYHEKIRHYEYEAKKLKFELDGDQAALLGLEQGVETEKKYGKGVNE